MPRFMSHWSLVPCVWVRSFSARIKRVVFGATEPKAGSLISARKLLESGYYNHILSINQVV